MPVPRDLLHLFAKPLDPPFDLLINHWDPGNLGIRPEVRECIRLAVAWTMWEFCCDEETEIFTQRGWLHWSEVTTQDQTLGINPETSLAEWQLVDEVSVFPGARKMVARESQAHSSLTTPDHRWLVKDGRGAWRWRTSATLQRHDRIPRAAELTEHPAEPKYSDALVELVAWYYTEGWLERGRQVRIGQNERASPAKTARIRSSLIQLFGPAVSRNSPQPGALTWSEGRKTDGMIHFNLSQAASDELTVIAPGKVPAHDFLLSLTRAQLELFIDVSCLADGWQVRSARGFAQALGPRLEAFVFACVLAGRTVSRPAVNSRNPHLASVLVGTRHRFVSPEKTRSGQSPEAVRQVEHAGIVWCPTVRLGNWLARRHGTMYYTGNTSLAPHCRRRSTLNKRLRLYDLFLGYSDLTLSACGPWLPPHVPRAVLQGGYDSRAWRPVERDWFGDRFQFVMHGALGPRKCPYTAIQAFLALREEHSEFAEHARLALHTNYGGHLFNEMNEVYKDQGIRIWVDNFDLRTLREFYGAGHCLLSPSRGEGKNLPALEFMSTGGAVAATNWSGHLNWMSEEYAYPLGYTLGPTFERHPGAAQDAKVSIEECKRAMWHIFTNRGEARRKGELAARTIPLMCDWSVVLEGLWQRIRDNCPHNGELIYDMAQEAHRRKQQAPRRVEPAQQLAAAICSTEFVGPVIPG